MLAGLSATVHFGGDLHVAGTIESGDRRRLTLVLPVPPQQAFHGRAGVVEYVSPIGVHRVQGRLQSDPVRREILYVTRDGGEVVQRREWARADAVLAVKLGAHGEVARCYTRNLSAGGMLVQDHLGLEPGDEVDFSLWLGEGVPPIVGRAAVTAVRAAHEVAALRFDRIGNADRERIVRYVLDRQRNELRVRRTQ